MAKTAWIFMGSENLCLHSIVAITPRHQNKPKSMYTFYENTSLRKNQLPFTPTQPRRLGLPSVLQKLSVVKTGLLFQKILGSLLFPKEKKIKITFNYGDEEFLELN